MCVSCAWVRVGVRMRPAARRELPQIELLINRPTSTWQSPHFSTTALTVSQILLIWQNPKIKQSPAIFRSAQACPWRPVPNASEQWVPDVWDGSSASANFVFRPAHAPAPDLGLLSGAQCAGLGLRDPGLPGLRLFVGPSHSAFWDSRG